MLPTTDFNAVELARTLLRRRRQGALATLMAEGKSKGIAKGGAPYCSLVNVASYFDASPILLISRLAIHTQNILADPRVSLMLDERAAGDPLEGARIMVAATAMAGDANDRRRYLNAHPDAQAFADFDDFSFFRLQVEGVHLVAGFGRIVDLPGRQVLTDLSGCETLMEAEADIIAHLNAEHLDTMNLYAVQLNGAAPGEWHCTGCDPGGIDLQDGNQSERISFSQRVVDPAGVRAALRELANTARRGKT